MLRNSPFSKMYLQNLRFRKYCDAILDFPAIGACTYSDEDLVLLHNLFLLTHRVMGISSTQALPPDTYKYIGPSDRRKSQSTRLCRGDL